MPNGVGRRQLTEESEAVLDPSWSPDGKRLVYVSDDEVRVIDENGESVRVVASGRDLSEPSYSPDGREIVFVKRQSIMVMEADGSRETRLLRSERGVLSAPVFSPNGRRIAFGGSPTGTARGIWTIRRDGSDLNRLTSAGGSESALYDDLPDYSPDGRRIAFYRAPSDTAYGGGQIFVVRADGSRARAVPRTRSYTSPAWAPSGRRIAIASEGYRLPPVCTDIYTVAPSGRELRAVTMNCQEPTATSAPQRAASPDWQPLP